VTHVLFCLPDRDFDTTEVATPWHRFREAGFKVTFATERGDVAACDPKLLTGVLFGKLGAQPDAIERYERMVQSHEFQHPRPWTQVDPVAYDALVLPGGHAQGMRPYLESETLRDVVRGFFALHKPVGAICHGVVVLARTASPATGKSVLHGRKVTGLLKSLERTGYYLTAWRLGKYYRTYPEYVQDEITRNLASKKDFQTGRAAWIAFAVRDGELVTARWPKDAELFAAELIHLLTGGPA
jgi:putative intracellular protease/amidase